MVFRNCNCHVKACPVCGQCPKHDCTHDGISLSAKANRKRGRQPGKLKRVTPNKRLASSAKINYSEGSMQELLNRDLADCFQNATAKPCKKVSDIAKAFELGDNYISHFPSLETRRNEPNLGTIDRHTSMVQFATRAFNRICEIHWVVVVGERVRSLQSWSISYVIT